MSYCELCGKNEPTQAVIVEGAPLQTCSGCGHYGTSSHSTESAERSFASKTRTKIIQKPEPPELKVTEAFADKLKQKREQMKATIEEFSKFLNERESLVSQWLSGSIRPSIDAAAKLERKLQTALLEQETSELVSFSSTSGSKFISALKLGSELTLGDFVKIRTRKKT